MTITLELTSMQLIDLRGAMEREIRTFEQIGDLPLTVEHMKATKALIDAAYESLETEAREAMNFSIPAYRVQVPAYTDHWMRGDRFGTVVKISKTRISNVRARLLTGKQVYDSFEVAHVKLDKSGKTAKFYLADCTLA